MKKLNLLLSLVLIILISYIGWLLYVYNQSFYNITFQDIPENSTLIIYLEGSETKNSTITKNDNVAKLRYGSYEYSILSDGYSDSRQKFSVTKNDQSIAVSSLYSEKKLSSLLKEQMDSIHQFIKKSYPETNFDYQVADGILIGKGDWYGTILYRPEEDSSIIEPYRIILKKENGDWKVAASPQILQTLPANPQIPKEIIQQVNNYSM